MNKTDLESYLLALDSDVKPREKADRAAITVPSEKLVNLMKNMRDDPNLAFDMLCAHTAIDWQKDDTIELIYQLQSTNHNHVAMVSVILTRSAPVIPSVSHLWGIAEWQEREVYDFFGVLYQNHPDLRRILLEDDWVGHPLLKDYQDDFMLERPW